MMPLTKVLLLTFFIVGSAQAGEKPIFDNSKTDKPYIYEGYLKLSPPKINSCYSIDVVKGDIIKIYDMPVKLNSLEKYIISNVKLKTEYTGKYKIKIVLNLKGFWIFMGK